MRSSLLVVAVVVALVEPAVAQGRRGNEAQAFDFTPIARQLIAVASCGGGTMPDGVAVARVEAHCKAIKKTQKAYSDGWLRVARPWFATHVPSGIPKKVVYPFAGGDLSTALTVYPDADEITTLSLEPAGDPRTLEVLRSKKDLERALSVIQYELNFLYKVNFSNTLNMIGAMRGGQLPTQLVFGLSALQVHGFEVVGLRYFKLDSDGSILYLTDEDVEHAPDPMKGKAAKRNQVFANAEIRYRRAGVPTARVQVYRHIQVNLDDEHLEQDPRVLAHLEQKGPIAGMTKAASYLLSWNNFSKIRDYLIKNVVWMVSDATGVAPKWGTPAGFSYETHGAFAKPHIAAGNNIAPDWKAEFAKQPPRPLSFRFGYYDGSSKHTNHLIIMRRAK